MGNLSQSSCVHQGVCTIGSKNTSLLSQTEESLRTDERILLGYPSTFSPLPPIATLSLNNVCWKLLTFLNLVIGGCHEACQGKWSLARKAELLMSLLKQHAMGILLVAFHAADTCAMLMRVYFSALLAFTLDSLDCPYATYNLLNCTYVSHHNLFAAPG